MVASFTNIPKAFKGSASPDIPAFNFSKASFMVYDMRGIKC